MNTKKQGLRQKVRDATVGYVVKGISMKMMKMIARDVMANIQEQMDEKRDCPDCHTPAGPMSAWEPCEVHEVTEEDIRAAAEQAKEAHV